MITFLYTLTNKYLCNQPCGEEGREEKKEMQNFEC
jgi:hypothetical protein